MWFKNLQLYRLPAPWNISRDVLEEKLSQNMARPCGSQEMITKGWASPREEGQFVYALGGQWLLSLRAEERILPSVVVVQEVRARADKLAKEQGYRPGRKMLREMKERVTEELLPRAFTRQRHVAAWVDPVNGWLGIDAASAVKAEELLECLRRSLDSLPLSLIQTERSPGGAMADWLTGGEAPAGFSIDRDCELKSANEEKAAVRYVRHPLNGGEIEAEIRAHIAAGKTPSHLALTWNDRISFVLTEKGEIKRLTFLDILKESAEQGIENADEIRDAEFSLMTGEFSRLIPALLTALGGEKKA